MVPQELGDFYVLTHGGWSKGSAVLFNFISGLTFLFGGLITYILSFNLDVSWLIPFAAGNFIYIGASDLILKKNKDTDFGIKNRVVTVVPFILGTYLFVLAMP
jgi:zinc and cadmium transporter